MEALNKVEQALEGAAEWVENLFAKIPHDIKTFANISIDILNKVKAALNSNTAVEINAIIPGDWDDNLVKSGYVLISGLITTLQSIGNSISDDDKDALIAKASSKLTALQDGNKLPQNKYDLYNQVAYSNQVNGNKDVSGPTDADPAMTAADVETKTAEANEPLDTE